MLLAEILENTNEESNIKTNKKIRKVNPSGYVMRQ
jgi:hypothetical protein